MCFLSSCCCSWQDVCVCVCLQLKDVVRQQAAYDVDPALSETASYVKNEMGKEGYRHLLAVGERHTSVAQPSVQAEHVTLQISSLTLADCT